MTHYWKVRSNPTDHPEPASSNRYNFIRSQIDTGLDRYLSLTHLDDRLCDLPQQFRRPQPRPWHSINWSAINQQQVIGMDVAVFLAILEGAIDTEAPIRQYTQTSRQYLEHLHPQMARFVGGTIATDGTLLEPGLWEKEERQHTPTLIKVYTQLSGTRVIPTPRVVRTYQPSGNQCADLYRHGLHRIATEYGATCLYLWLMAHTIGPLQAVLAELVQDEINHTTKFLGFGAWAFPQASLYRMGQTILQSTQGRLVYSPDRSSLLGTLHRMTGVLNWHAWSWLNRATFVYTCSRAFSRLWHWSHQLSPDRLQTLLGPSPFH